MKSSIEFQKTYIPDVKVKALRDAGITNFSKFVREKVDEYLEARRNLPQNQTGNAVLKESNPQQGASKCQP